MGPITRILVFQILRAARAASEAGSYNAFLLPDQRLTYYEQVPNGTVVLEPELARSDDTTKWLNRDKQRVTEQRGGPDGESGIGVGGNVSELLVQPYLSRHYLYRRADAKFAEFLTTSGETEQEGFGLWRLWESHGACPRELLVSDPWGSVSWESRVRLLGLGLRLGLGVAGDC